MKHLSLFSGIGGFDLAAEWMGWENVSHTEWNAFGQSVLQDKYPNATTHHDITKTNFTIYKSRIDIVTGGFPCQPYSVAGKRKGKDDERHLWPEMLRAIREIAPRWVVGENVRGIINWDSGVVFDEVQADLEAEGYEILPFLLPAASVNAPHERYRTWFIAYSHNAGSSTGLRPVSKEDGEIYERDKDAEFSDAGAGIDKNTNCNGRYGKLRKNKPRIRQQRNIGTGNYERLRTHNEKTGDASDTETKRRSHVGEKQENTFINGFNTERSGNLQLRPRMGINGRIIFKRTMPKMRGIRGVCKLSESGVFTNSHSGRQPSEEYRQKKSGQPTKEGVPGNWQDFPTQSPVCNGDDGFPTESLRQRIREDSMGVISEEEIDKIISAAYNQWRNETIKAGGNAVVPPLVLQIFKAIQQYENQ